MGFADARPRAGYQHVWRRHRTLFIAAQKTKKKFVYFGRAFWFIFASFVSAINIENDWWAEINIKFNLMVIEIAIWFFWSTNTAA